MNNFDFSDLGGKRIQQGTSDFSDLGGVRIQPSSSTFGQKAASLAKGAISGLGGGALDTAALIYNLPAMLHNWQEEQRKQVESLPQEKREQFQKIPIIPNPMDLLPRGEAPYIPSATEAIEHGIDTLTGGYTETPEELKHLYEGAKFAGSLGGIGGLGKAAGKLGAKGFEKAGQLLGVTAPAELGGALATGTAMSAVDENLGPLAGLGAGALTGALTTKGLQGLKGTITGKGPTLGEITVGKALSLMGKPSKSVEYINKKYHLEVPFNLRLQGPMAHLLANVGLKTWGVAQDYIQGLEKAPKKMVDILVKEIDSIYPENIGNIPSSEKYRNFLKQEQETVREQSNKLYNTAFEYLNKNETIPLNHTAKAIKDLRSEITAPVPSADQKFVMSKVNKLGEYLGLIKPPKGILGFTDIELESPKLYEKVLHEFEKNPHIEAKIYDMAQQRSAFLNDTQYGGVKGIRGKLGKLISSLNKDIENTSNKEFLNHWKGANSYYRMESANRVRSDLAHSLTEGTVPKEAYDFMTSPGTIQELKKIIGDSVNGNQIFNALKRAKLNDVVIDKVVDKDGFINHGAFAKLFSKGNKQQSLLQSLLGHDSYSKLQELSQLSDKFSKASQQFANFSGTTKTAQDLAKIYSLGKGLLDIVMGGGSTLFLSGIGVTAGPYFLSKLLANPRYINAAVKYGSSVKSGHLHQADHFDKSMKNIFYDTMRKQVPTVINEQLENQ